jgi:hypothetical protein
MTAKKGNQYAVGNKGGRPSKYDPKYCQQIIDWFSIEPSREVEIPHYKDGEITWTDFKKVPNKLPTYHEFARHIKVNQETLTEWVGVYKEFSAAFTYTKELQKYFIVQNGLAGIYNPTFSQFVMTNITDWKNKQEFDHLNNGTSFNSLTDADLLAIAAKLVDAKDKK